MYKTEEEEAGLKEIGRIYQDLEDPAAPVYILLIDTAYKIDCRLLQGRLLKNAESRPIKSFRPEGNL